MIRKRIVLALNKFIERQNAKLGIHSASDTLGTETDHDATISATVRRADGSVEDLGVVSNAKATHRGTKKLNEV